MRLRASMSATEGWLAQRMCGKACKDDPLVLEFRGVDEYHFFA